MQLILLCAGKGSRLPKLERNQPKCLIKINSKKLILYNYTFIKKFKHKIIITGYKNKILKLNTKNLETEYIYNKNYRNTNMVYSLYLARKKVIDDIVIMYGDIVFDSKIFNLLKPKKNIMPINKNWLINWKSRMGMSKTLLDAEDIKIIKNKVINIGSKINKSHLPKYQYMGLIKLKKKVYINMMEYFEKLKNKRIDMTTFINLTIQKKILKLNAVKTGMYWFEVDNKRDLKFAAKKLKKINYI